MRAESFVRVLLLIAMLCGASPATAGPEEGMFQAAKIIFTSTDDDDPVAKRASYRSVRDIFDSIVETYPASDIAVRILLQDTIDGIDVAALNAFLDQPATPQPEASESASVEASPSDPVVEFTLLQPDALPVLPTPRSEKEIVKDLQTELNRVGCGAGTADGIAGNRTKRAFRMFLENSGQFLDEGALATEAGVAAVRGVTEPVCSLRWAAANVPAAISGAWGLRSECRGLLGRKITVRGSISLNQTSSGAYSGTIRITNGPRGSIYVEGRGNSIYTVSTYGSQKVRSQLTMSSKNMSASGTDSQGCSVVVWKS